MEGSDGVPPDLSKRALVARAAERLLRGSDMGGVALRPTVVGLVGSPFRTKATFPELKHVRTGFDLENRAEYCGGVQRYHKQENESMGEGNQAPDPGIQDINGR